MGLKEKHECRRVTHAFLLNPFSPKEQTNKPKRNTNTNQRYNPKCDA
jgi:hypothetical protein